jgi:hypothetical protein
MSRVSPRNLKAPQKRKDENYGHLLMIFSGFSILFSVEFNASPVVVWTW